MGSNGRTLLVVSDYFSNFIEVSRLQAITTQAVVCELKTFFARFGIPETLVTDNGPQFASKEFGAFGASPPCQDILNRMERWKML